MRDITLTINVFGNKRDKDALQITSRGVFTCPLDFERSTDLRKCGVEAHSLLSAGNSQPCERTDDETWNDYRVLQKFFEAVYRDAGETPLRCVVPAFLYVNRILGRSHDFLVTVHPWDFPSVDRSRIVLSRRYDAPWNGDGQLLHRCAPTRTDQTDILSSDVQTTVTQ
jgi:hypothetical protein